MTTAREAGRAVSALAPEAPSGGRMASEAGGVMAAELASVALRYGGSIFLVRATGLTWFGSVTLGFTIANLLSMVAVMGVAPGALPFLARARRGGRTEEVLAVVRSAWALVALAGGVIGALMYLLAPWLAAEVFGKPRLGPVLRPLSALVLFSALTTASACLIQGFLGVRRQAFIERTVVTAVMVLGFALSWAFGWGVPGVLAAAVAGPVVGLLVALAFLAQLAPGAMKRSAPSAPLVVGPLARESWPLMGTSMFAFILMWMDVLLMGVLRSEEEVALYGAAARIAPAVMLVTNAAGPVFLARLSAAFAEGDWGTIRQLYKTTGLWSLWSGAVVAAMLLVWGPQLLALFGPGFVAGAAALSLLATGRLASAVGGMCGRMLSITGKARVNLANVVLLVVCNGLLDLYWIPRHGAVGAAGATCISVALVNALQTAQVWRFYRVHPFSRRSAVGLLGTAGLAALVWPWRGGVGGAWGWLLPLALFLAASATLFLAAGAGEEERAYLRRLLPRRGR